MEPNKAPTISIGMPVYNGEKYLRLAIESLLSQTFANFELIISDNASTDKTREICAEYARSDQRVKIHSQKVNIGAINNFNYVLMQATGRYFMWAAADDMWDARWLEVLVNGISDEDFSVCGLVEFIDSDEKTIKQLRPKSYSKRNWMSFIFDADPGCVFYVYGLIRRENALSCVEVLRRGLFADVLFVYAGIAIGGVRCVPNTVIKYRSHPTSVSAKMNSNNIWVKFRRLIMVNSVNYYKGYFDLTPKEGKIVSLFVILARWQKDQFRHYIHLLKNLKQRIKKR